MLRWVTLEFISLLSLEVLWWKGISLSSRPNIDALVIDDRCSFCTLSTIHGIYRVPNSGSVEVARIRDGGHRHRTWGEDAIFNPPERVGVIVYQQKGCEASYREEASFTPPAAVSDWQTAGTYINNCPNRAADFILAWVAFISVPRFIACKI